MRIYKKRMFRLLSAWLFLSRRIGTVVFWMEAKKIDADVVALAAAESPGSIAESRTARGGR